MKQLILSAFLFVSLIGYGQWTYNVASFTDAGNPGGLNTEADAGGQGTWTTIIAGPQGANTWSPSTAIPFAFDFYGSPVTAFKASQNGLVTFDVAATALPSVNDNLPSVNLPNTVICGFWDEFTASAPTGSGDDIRTNTYGTAPNRQFWIRWYSFEMGNPTSSFNYFTVVLEESTNKIYVVSQYGNAAAMSATVGVQESATNAVQFGANNINFGGNGSGNADNDYYEFTPVLLLPNNIGVSAVTAPNLPYAAGMSNVEVEVTNYGTNAVTSFNVDWEVNNVGQAQYIYSGPSLAAGATSAPLTIGTFNFPGGNTDMKIWTSLPNGLADANPADDTLWFAGCTSLSGTYTVGGATPDYPTLTDAVNAISICGISGPVVFDVQSGTYSESLAIGTVLGSSAANTITFDGGNVATILHDGVGQRGVVELQGTDYITFKNFTIENTATSAGWGFHLRDTADYVTIDSCIILLDSTGTTDLISVVVSGSNVNDFTEGNGANSLTVSNNVFAGGEMGVHIEGLAATAQWADSITIINNEFSYMDDYGIYADNVNYLTVFGNYIHDVRNTAGDGIYLLDQLNVIVEENNVSVNDYGIYVADNNFDATGTIRSRVVNNMVISSSDYAIYLDDINDIDIWHNTAQGNPGIRINDFSNMDIRNNIFTSLGDYAFESDETVGGQIVNNNLYYTSASNALYAKDGTSTYTSLALWQTGQPALNTASVENDPIFVSTTDLHVVGVSANDVGDNTVGVFVDIDGDARPQSPATTVDIGADEFTPLADDAQMVGLYTPIGGSCGDVNTDVYVIVNSLGVNTITSLPITVEVTGAVVQTLSTTYTTPITFNVPDTVLVGTINTYAGGTYIFDGSVSLLGDQDVSNDTLVTVTASIIPFEPLGFSDSICGLDSITVYADSAYPVVYEWYDAASGGALVGTGNSFVMPSISTQSTYYLGYAALAPGALSTTYASGNGCGGGNMFDVTGVASTTISGFDLHSDDAAGSPVTADVYYIANATYVGNQTNAAAWTNAGSYTVTSGGLGNPTSTLTLTTPISLSAGQTYAFYIVYDAEYTTGSGTYTDGTITITTGDGFCAAFGSPNTGREFNGTVHYGSTSCSSILSPISANTLPTPPQVNAGPDTTVCNTTYLLDGGLAGFDYVWSTGDSTQTTTATSSDLYIVDMFSPNGCSTRDSVNVLIGNITASANLDTTICMGDSALVMATASSIYPYTILWSNTDTTLSFYGATDDMYVITVTDSLNCAATDSMDLTVLDINAGFAVSTLDGVTFDFTDNSIDADSVVYDFGDGTTSSLANPTHTYTVNASYTVCQIAYNQCGSDTSCQTIDVTVIGINDIERETFVMYPNPTNDLVNVVLVEGAISMNILSIDGKVLMTQTVNGTQEQVDLSELANGQYIIQVMYNNRTLQQRVIKQ